MPCAGRDRLKMGSEEVGSGSMLLQELELRLLPGRAYQDNRRDSPGDEQERGQGEEEDGADAEARIHSAGLGRERRVTWTGRSRLMTRGSRA